MQKIDRVNWKFPVTTIISVLYPIIATSYIWVALLSTFFFAEVMNLYKWIGIFFIISGVVFVSMGSKKDGLSYTEVA